MSKKIRKTDRQYSTVNRPKEGESKSLGYKYERLFGDPDRYIAHQRGYDNRLSDGTR